MERYSPFSSRVMLLPVNDIDTDQIIPARFLKITDKSGLGEKLFSNWRYLADGSADPAFVLNQPENKEVQILLAGNNFGCGSSREHAPWALLSYGFRAVIATSFADIFRNNSLKNGLLPIIVSTEAHGVLIDYIQQHPYAEIQIDLENQSITLPDGVTFEFPMDPFSKMCMLQGVDELEYLLTLDVQIDAYERAHSLLH